MDFFHNKTKKKGKGINSLTFHSQPRNYTNKSNHQNSYWNTERPPPPPPQHELDMQKQEYNFTHSLSHFQFSFIHITLLVQQKRTKNKIRLFHFTKRNKRDKPLPYKTTRVYNLLCDNLITNVSYLNVKQGI